MLITLNEIRDILGQTANNLPFLIWLLLLSGVAAYFLGRIVKEKTGNTVKRIFPLVAAELILFLYMLPYLVRWVGMGSFSWGFWYEGGWDFYIPFTLMIGILIGYPLGITYIKEARIRGMVISQIIWAVALIVAAGVLIGSFNMSFQSYLSHWGPFTPSLVLLPMLTIASGIVSLFLLWNIKQTLIQGKTLPKFSTVQQFLFRFPLLLTILFLVLILVDTGIRVKYFTQEEFMDPAMLSFPQPSLVELENSPDLILDDLNSAYRFHPEDGTYAAISPTFWSPVHITLCWSGIAKNTWWRDLVPGYSLNMRYSPSINVDLWETRGRLLARLLYDDLPKRDYDWETHQVLTLDYVEQAEWFISEENNTQLLIMHQGNRVAAIQYHGAVSMDSLFPTLQRMFIADWM